MRVLLQTTLVLIQAGCDDFDYIATQLNKDRGRPKSIPASKYRHHLQRCSRHPFYDIHAECSLLHALVSSPQLMLVSVVSRLLFFP